MQFGAAAAAFLVGEGQAAAEILGSAAETSLLVDHFRAAGAPYDYAWEERWIRDEGYTKIGSKAVKAALADAELTGAQVDRFIFPSPLNGVAEAIAKATGIAPEAVADSLSQDGGYAGAAHGLLMLANVLDQAAPGQVIVVAGFGQGAEVVVLRTTDAVAQARPSQTVADAQARGVTVTAYAQMASFYDEIAPEWGMRAERDTKTSLTELYRSADQVVGFVAGKCGACGQVQFPQLAYCVNCRAPASGFEQTPLAEETARVLTFTADSLMYHPSPPLYIGFAQFDIGARLLMEFVDLAPETFDVGTRLRMTFRIKEKDSARGFYRYFWKAAPIQ
jgi:uncharacterized OB-fold protein